MGIVLLLQCRKNISQPWCWELLFCYDASNKSLRRVVRENNYTVFSDYMWRLLVGCVVCVVRENITVFSDYMWRLLVGCVRECPVLTWLLLISVWTATGTLQPPSCVGTKVKAAHYMQTLNNFHGIRKFTFNYILKSISSNFVAQADLVCMGKLQARYTCRSNISFKGTCVHSWIRTNQLF